LNVGSVLAGLQFKMPLFLVRLKENRFVSYVLKLFNSLFFPKTWKKGLVFVNRFTFVDTVFTRIHNENMGSESGNLLSNFVLKSFNYGNCYQVNNNS
jgi:hypothetical protein